MPLSQQAENYPHKGTLFFLGECQRNQFQKSQGNIIIWEIGSSDVASHWEKNIAETKQKE